MAPKKNRALKKHGRRNNACSHDIAVFNCSQNIVFSDNKFDEKKISDYSVNSSSNRSSLSKKIHTQIELNKFISLLSNNIDNLKANSQNQLNTFVEENSITFPILYDPGSPGGVQGGNTYNDYYMPNDGSPYPRDFIINQDGVIAYANNEIDTQWMLSVIYDLLDHSDVLIGDVNEDQIINILDIIAVINFVLSNNIPSENQFMLSDLNSDQMINILDVVILVNIILE